MCRSNLRRWVNKALFSLNIHVNVSFASLTIIDINKKSMNPKF